MDPTKAARWWRWVLCWRRERRWWVPVGRRSASVRPSRNTRCSTREWGCCRGRRSQGRRPSTLGSVVATAARWFESASHFASSAPRSELESGQQEWTRLRRLHAKPVKEMVLYSSNKRTCKCKGGRCELVSRFLFQVWRKRESSFWGGRRVGRAERARGWRWS